MNDPNTTQPIPLRTPARHAVGDQGVTDRTSFGRLKRITTLPPALLRSAAPGYLLAGAALIALGGFITWRVVGQTEAIRAAEAKAPPLMTVEAPENPTPVLRELPHEWAPGSTGEAPTSQVTTTGALVPVPSATQPPEAKPSAAPTVAAEPAKPTAPVIAHGEQAASPAPKTHPARAHTPRPQPTSDEDNPYGQDSPAPASSGEDRLFDARE